MSQKPTEAAATTGVIGLGVMGHPMAANILRSGTAVHITGRSPEKYGDLIEAGAVWHDTAQSLADAVGVIVLMLPDLPQVEGCRPVLTGIHPRAFPAAHRPLAPITAHRQRPQPRSGLAAGHPQRHRP
jgi:3-hydroxyisobutyrate dehydrogenase-like beta-hydroxyacid dehydrogenase